METQPSTSTNLDMDEYVARSCQGCSATSGD